MADRPGPKAEYPQSHRFHLYFCIGKAANVTRSLLLLAWLVLFLGSCAFPSNNTTTPGSAATDSQKPAGQLTYVAIGASDTFGFGTNDPYNQNWASDLAFKLGPRYHLINLGIPSIQAHEALSVELPVALDAHPDLVTIWLAVNDIIDNVPVQRYTQDLDTLLSRLQAANPHMHIAVANVPDLALLPYFQRQKSFDHQALQDQITAYNTAIATLVNTHHAILIDLSQHGYDLQHHPEYISQDGLHPTANGYTRLADLFYQALQRA